MVVWLGSGILVVVIAWLRYGYHFGLEDQFVLSLRGIANADPTALVNDWFTTQVRYPHWHFDLITEIGERLQNLEAIYFLYWTATIFILFQATWKLLGITKSTHLVVPALFIYFLGPVSTLGSTTAIVWNALPHSLGTALAVLSFSYFLEGKHWKYALAMFGSISIHLQLGALLAMCTIISGSVGIFRREDKASKAILGWNLAGLIYVFVIAKQLGFVSTGTDFLRVCRYYIPAHCYSPSWSLHLYLILPTIVLGCMACYHIYAKEKLPSHHLLIFWLGPTLLLMVLIGDRFDLWPLATFVRKFHMNRIATPLAYFSVVGIVIYFSCPKGRQKIIFHAVGLSSLLFLWFSASDSHFNGDIFMAAFFAISISTSIILYCSTQLKPLARTLGFVFLLVPLVLPGPDWNAALRALGQIGMQIEKNVPPGEIILANPAFDFLRFYSKRGVVADFKAIPFGGDQLKEWEYRIADLGGYDLTGKSYKNLSFEKWLEAAHKYNAKFALTTADDPKTEMILEKFKLVKTFNSSPVLYLLRIAE